MKINFFLINYIYLGAFCFGKNAKNRKGINSKHFSKKYQVKNTTQNNTVSLGREPVLARFADEFFKIKSVYISPQSLGSFPRLNLQHF